MTKQERYASSQGKNVLERVLVNGMAPSASLRASRRRPRLGASASRAIREQMERIAPRKISPETVIATFGRTRSFVSQLALR
jgi:hypothetical protein